MGSNCSSMWDLDTPVLVLDLDALEANIAYMANFMAGATANLRPHSKTHKCAEIAKRQLAAGAVGITCAKLGEAEALAPVAPDILIANQIIGPTKIGRLVRLRRHTDVMVAVDDPTNIDELSAAAVAAGVTLRLLVEVDIGMGRCGVDTPEQALELAQRVDRAPGLVFAGLQGYEGHAVMLPEREARREAAEKAMGKLTGVRSFIEQSDLPVAIVSGGGTGTYNVTGNFPGVDEVQAGSYATMDARYGGLLPEFRPALSVLATVVSKPTVDRVIADAGLKSITPEFGMPVVLQPEGLTTAKLSEEHGTHGGPGAAGLRLGDKIRLQPTHGCTTINLHDRYFVVQGERVVDVWPVDARGRSA